MSKNVSFCIVFKIGENLNIQLRFWRENSIFLNSLILARKFKYFKKLNFGAKIQIKENFNSLKYFCGTL